MSTHVTVGYDGSHAARDAAMWAADEAVARGVPLRIVSSYPAAYVADPTADYLAANAHETVRASTELSLVEIGDAVAARHPGLDVTAAVSGDAPHAALVADVSSGDLLVVGASRHHGAAAFWLGSTPRAVARRSPCPVVVVRGAASGGRPNRIVVGVDGSATADEALDWACDEADLHRTELVVVHAWDYPYTPLDFSASQARDLMRVDAAGLLERAVSRARERSGAQVTDVLADSSAADAVLAAARDGDLVVLGSRGRGAVAAGLFGSTVNAVLERAAVPVVVVRHHAE